MKRHREEESEDEVFERRRKVHRHEKDAKDEIEDLFEENSSEHTVEEKSEEIEGWGITGGAAAGVLLEIFGDGTDYLHVLEHYSKQHRHEEEPEEKSVPEKVEIFSKIDKEEIVSKVTESLLESVFSFPKDSVEKMVAAIVDDYSLVDVISEFFHCLDTPQNHMAILQAKKLVSLYKDKERIFSQLPKIVDKNVKTVISCAHTLKTPEEYTRLVQYVYRLQSNACTAEDREMAANITQKITNVSIYYTDYAAVNSDDQIIKIETEEKEVKVVKEKIKPEVVRKKGLLHNPWIFRTAVEVGMEISEIEIQGSETVKILARTISNADMYLLQFLKNRGVSYRIILNIEETINRIAHKLDGSTHNEEDLKDAISYFIEKSAEDVCRGIEKELTLFAEEHIKIELFEKLSDILNVKAGKESIIAIWLDKGKIRYTKTEHKVGIVSNGIAQSRDELITESHTGIIALTGKGYKLKQFAKCKNKVYINEELLNAMGDLKDLSALLCKVVKNPVNAAENVLGREKKLPNVIFLQSMLRPDIAAGVFEYAVAYKRAEAQVYESSEYISLKKEVLEFLRSGGDPEVVLLDKHATCEGVRRAVKETAVPRTGWNRLGHDLAIENKIFKRAYRHCVNKLENISEVAGTRPMTKHEEFLVFNNATEEELLSLESSWTLSCGAKINMPGRVLEGTITGINQETHVRLSNGVSAVLNGNIREGLVNGQKLQVRVLGLDILNYRAIVREERKDSSTLLRAQSHWRVKSISAKLANRILKDKSFGSYVLRVSSTHPDSLILTIRITENPEKCVCAHMRVREIRDGYELEGRLFKEIESITEVYIPNYLKSFKRVMEHRKFTTESVDSIKQRLVQTKHDRSHDKYALSISKTSPGCVSFIYLRNKEEAAEILLPVVEKGLHFDRRIYAKPEDFIAVFNSSNGE